MAEIPESLEKRVLEVLAGPAAERAQALERLLARHVEHADAVRAWLANPSARGPRTQRDPEAARSDQPERIGPFWILETLGEGGMGTVYLAEQEEPVRRRVALKLIKLGMDTREVLARFATEQQVLAILDHPCIARVLDAGTTEQGRPYFVMEYVPGIPLTRYCDQERLSISERLRLFIQVCLGVQHAHQKGIIHRDLKPQNLLVAQVDGVPVPKIIDFGLAKATQSQMPRSSSLHTEQGRILGTLEYMSPEQVDLRGADIDTTTDVYSLGVVLYELLTGALPFDPEEMRAAGVAELQRRIREVDPPRPSTRVLAAAHGAEAARARGLEPRTLSRALYHELDWITLRALEKDRTRRYASASELAADVRRYLEGESVQAAQPSQWHLVRRFARRHRATIAAAATALLALTAGLVLALVKAHEAGLARAAAEALAQERAAAIEDFRRMADVQRLADLRRVADETLWPALPDKSAAMAAWLGQAELLAARLDLHHRKLDQLDAAISGSPAPDAEQIWQRDTIRGLVQDLTAFTSDARNGIAGVRQRLELARNVEPETVGRFRDQWTAAIASIADPVACPRYAGLRIQPQLGLVPLGRNAQSGLWEFWHQPTGSRPKWRGEDGRCRVDGDSGLVLVLMPGGTARMGITPLDDPSASEAERNSRQHASPVHEVALVPFFLSRFEMTQGQWERWTGHNPSKYFPDARWPRGNFGLTNPVENVSWEDCRRTLWQMGLLVPTEAQWEYACRAGTATEFSTGDTVQSLLGFANIADEGSKSVYPTGWSYEPDFDDGNAAHAPVGSFAPNGFGLHDMHGNVSEWCRDGLGNYADPVHPGDGERMTDNPKLTVERGGHCTHIATRARSWMRSWAEPHTREFSLGVRPSRALREL